MREGAALALFLALAALPSAPASAAAVSPARAAELERLVAQDCGACHGLTRKGGLGPDIRAQSLAGRPEEAVTRIVLDGVPGTAMPPWSPLLTEDEARWIAHYLMKGEAR